MLEEVYGMQDPVQVDPHVVTTKENGRHPRRLIHLDLRVLEGQGLCPKGQVEAGVRKHNLDGHEKRASLMPVIQDVFEQSRRLAEGIENGKILHPLALGHRTNECLHYDFPKVQQGVMLIAFPAVSEPSKSRLV